jgi:hypothetical protein
MSVYKFRTGCIGSTADEAVKKVIFRIREVLPLPFSQRQGYGLPVARACAEVIVDQVSGL